MAGGVPPRDGSGDDIRDCAVVDELDLILDLQLAFLQPRHLDLVMRTGFNQGGDLLIQLSVLPFQSNQQFCRVIVVHRQQGALIQQAGTPNSRGGSDDLPNGPVEWMQCGKTKCLIRDLLLALSRTSSKGLATMDKAYVEALSSKHAALQTRIEQEEHRSNPDIDLVHQLKKQKLRLKDTIVGH